MQSSSHPLRGFARALLAASLLVSAACPLLAGPSAKEKLEKSILTPEPEPSRVHVLLNLDISDHYITPRGLNVENQGVVFQPLLLVFWNLYNNPDGFINDVTITTGVWNSIHTRESGADPSHWNEIDPIGGLTVKMAKAVTLDVFWSAFQSQTDSYETSNNLSIKLTYHDSFFGRFSMNPYVEYWKELSDKATVVFNPTTSDESYYFSIGINPTYKFESIPLTVSLPTFINIAGKDFYQRFDGTPGGSGLAVFSTQFKVSTPLSFIPKSYGNWTAYAAVQYYEQRRRPGWESSARCGRGARGKPPAVPRRHFRIFLRPFRGKRRRCRFPSCGTGSAHSLNSISQNHDHPLRRSRPLSLALQRRSPPGEYRVSCDRHAD